MYHYKSEERENLSGLEFGDRLLDTISKAHSMREKLKLGFIKTKNIYAVKETFKRIERHAIDWNKLLKKKKPHTWQRSCMQNTEKDLKTQQ